MIYLNTCCCDEHVVFNVQYDEGTPSPFTLHSSQMVEFIKNLQREDEVTVTLHTGQQKICPRIFSSQRNYKTPPFPYQQQGIDYGLSGHNNWLLLDAPGLGKTLQLTYLAKELKERQGLQHCLIICGINTLKTNWKNEIEKHSNLSCRILGQRITKKGNFVVDGIQERLKQLKEPIDEFFVITNVETLREDKIVQAILKNKYNKFDMIVVDEIHRCLDENTIIETDRGMYTIGEIVRNKLTCKVKSYDESKERICMSDVTNWYQNSCVTSMLELTFEDELGVTHTLNCTDNHLIYTYNRGYVKAKDLTEEDIVNIGTQLKAKLLSKKIIEVPESVYDIEVADTHCFYANNILVHNCKTPTSQQGKNLLKLNKAKYRIGATGTLLLNNPLDAYVPLKWIGAERSNYSTFRYYYCNYGGPFGNMLVGFKNVQVLQDQIKKYSLRRTKDILNLPPKNIIHEYVDMSDAQSIFYENVKAGVAQEVNKIKLNAANVLSLVARLRQATACPSILTTESIPSAKMDRAEDLVEQIVGSGYKVVIFSTFKQTVYELAQRLRQYKLVVATGDQSDVEIEAAKQALQEDPDTKIFIGTWQKCGTGITLTAASYMIFTDTPWTDADFCQASDRIHRIGTKDSVFIYNLVTRGTIDERVLELVTDKAAIADYIVDEKITPQGLDSLRKYIEDII